MSTNERRALAILLAVGAAGHLIRLLALGPDEAPGGLSIVSATGPSDLAVHRGRSAATGRPLATGERIDLNTATASELDRLPGVGAGLAARLVAERRKRGRFLSLASVDSVPGVGAGLLDRIAPFVRLPDTTRRPAQSVVPGAPPAPQVLLPRRGARSPLAAKVAVNRASETDLQGLRGIGPARAKAIVAYRQANGPFASVKELEKVPGLSPAIVRRLADQVIVP